MEPDPGVGLVAVTLGEQGRVLPGQLLSLELELLEQSSVGQYWWVWVCLSLSHEFFLWLENHPERNDLDD